MYKYPPGWSIVGIRNRVVIIESIESQYINKKTKSNSNSQDKKEESKKQRGVKTLVKVYWSKRSINKSGYIKHLVKYGVRGDYINKLREFSINNRGATRGANYKRSGEGTAPALVGKLDSNKLKTLKLSFLIKYLFLDIGHEASKSSKNYKVYNTWEYKSRYRNARENKIIDTLLKKRHLKLIKGSNEIGNKELFIKGDRYNVLDPNSSYIGLVNKYINSAPLPNSCTRRTFTSNKLSDITNGSDSNLTNSNIIYYKNKKQLEDLIHHCYEGVIYLESDVINGVNSKLLIKYGEIFNNAPQSYRVGTSDFYTHGYKGNQYNKNIPSVHPDVPRIKTIDSGYINLRYKEVPSNRARKIKTIEEWVTYKTKVKRINLTEGIKEIYRQEVFNQQAYLGTTSGITLIKDKVIERQLEGNYLSEALIMSVFLETFFEDKMYYLNPPTAPKFYNELNISDIEETSLNSYFYTRILGYIVKILEKKVWFDSKQQKVKYLLKWERADNIPYIVADDLELPPDWLPK